MAKTESRNAGKTSKITTVGELEKLYPHEWVAIEVTREARRDELVRGRLIAHGDRESVHQATMEYRDQHPGVVTYAFYTTPNEPHEGWAVVL